jgi:hypothetical protein
MRFQSVLQNVAIVLAAVALWLQPLKADIQSTERDKIHARVDGYWKSIESLEYKCDEYDLDSQGQRDPTHATMTYHYSWVRGGKRALAVTNIDTNNACLMSDEIREDGNRSYSIRCFVGYKNDISQVIISSQNSSDDSYHGMMNSVLWLTTPGGSPINKHLADGASVESISEGSDNNIVLTFLHAGTPVKCLLDSTHDWLPKRVQFQDSDKTLWEVTKFQRINGHWFPLTGVFAGRILNEQPHRGLTVYDITINHAIPESRFELPKLVPGVVVSDSIKHSNYMIGGYNMSARKALEEKHNVRRTPIQPATGPLADKRDDNSMPVLAVRTEWPIVGLLAVASAMLLVAAFIVWLYRGVSAKA